MEVLNDKEFQLIAKCQDFIKRFHTNISDSDGNDIDYDDVCEKVKERNPRTLNTYLTVALSFFRVIVASFLGIFVPGMA